MIPKIIHYCWISNDPYSEIIKACIESWQKYCPEYTIKLWDYNELIKINNLPNWVNIALNNKKYAFVSDYIRYYAVYNYGGFYADSDYKLIKEIPNNIFNYDFVSSIEDTRDVYNGFHNINGFKFGIGVNGAFFGGKQYNKVCKSVLDYYNNEYNKIFNINKINNSYFPIAPQILSKCLENFGFDYQNIHQNIFNNIYLDKKLVLNIGFPYDSLSENEKNEVIGLHLCCGSWR